MRFFEHIQAMTPENGYHISGIIWLGYGSNFEKVEREIDIKIVGSDAALLAQSDSERAMGAMIANVYHELDIDEEEPPFLVCDLEKWDLNIERIAV